MFDYYQVERVEAKFVPYKYETTNSTAGVSTVVARPVYSIVDPDPGVGPTNVPDTATQLASFGNMRVTLPYHMHSRSLPYHQLGLQKQDKLILPTNG